MWKLALIASAFALTVTLAPAQPEKPGQVALQEDRAAALNELASEYLQCAAYFTVAAHCMAGFPAPAVPKLIRDNQQSAKVALALAISNGRSVGLTKALAEAGSKLVAAAQMSSINGNCLKIGNVSKRYDLFCKRLMQGPDERFAELLERRICTGLFKCALSRRSGE